MSSKEIRKQLFQRARRIVVKVGSSILASKDAGLHRTVFSHLAKEISTLKHEGYEIILVSSGAIAAGMEKLRLQTRPQTITQKQAAAAVGQSVLMSVYDGYFSRHHQTVAQVLLTHDDLSHRRRFINARNTLLALLKLGIIPIINENDTVAVDEPVGITTTSPSFQSDRSDLSSSSPISTGFAFRSPANPERNAYRSSRMLTRDRRTNAVR
jgi:glutamate 5-kinase